MTMIAAISTTISTDAFDYLLEQIDDEKRIAFLLGHRDIESPTRITSDCVLTATFRTGDGPPDKRMLPRWRREWAGAGQLIARCQLLISTTPAAVSVNDICAHYDNHPTPDDAIRFAMCKAAIAFLTAQADIHLCQHNFVKYMESGPGATGRTDYYRCAHCGLVRKNEIPIQRGA